MLTLLTWIIIIFGVAIITYGVIIAVEMNKLINKTVPRGTQMGIGHDLN
jgi:type IV secretory pathway TrbD component